MSQKSSLPQLTKSVSLVLIRDTHTNTAVVALAAKMARIVWTPLRHERTYETTAVAA